ncbi:hypothetical protein [Uliginosibacterium sediminicola]|uniref:Uncharacterized protein n=1 Tax=Uliginosibacterium sediminicola TaxID=2024550 RepID=A0ABU9YW33_9RHOO
MKRLTTVERLGLAALALHESIATLTAARAEKRSAFELAQIPADSDFEALTEGEREIVAAPVQRFKDARRAVKKARSALRRLSVAYLRAQREQERLEASQGLQQIELFSEETL